MVVWDLTPPSSKYKVLIIISSYLGKCKEIFSDIIQLTFKVLKVHTTPKGNGKTQYNKNKETKKQIKHRL